MVKYNKIIFFNYTSMKLIILVVFGVVNTIQCYFLCFIPHRYSNCQYCYLSMAVDIHVWYSITKIYIDVVCIWL